MIDNHPLPEFEKDSLNVTPEERVRIEIATRNQSKSAEWHMMRSRRITGSIIGKILKQKEPTQVCFNVSFIPNCLLIFHLLSNKE